MSEKPTFPTFPTFPDRRSEPMSDPNPRACDALGRARLSIILEQRLPADDDLSPLANRARAWLLKGVPPQNVGRYFVLMQAGRTFKAMRALCKKTCGARNRKGGFCFMKPIPGKKRCRFHGGLSTGPRTEEGRARCAEANRRRWAAWRERKTASEQI